MNFKELIVLLPCQSLESLSLDRDAAEAEQLLSAWTALYWPGLLVQAPAMPRWCDASSPPEDVSGCLVVLPECAEESLPADWLDRAATSDARVIQHVQRREEVIAAALAGCDVPPSVANSRLREDFLALGYCHFVVELLTRQQRYMSNLDTDRFSRHALDAIQHLTAGDETAAADQLRGAFDRLTEAREYFYPAETHLVDLTLTAETTLGGGLRRELAVERPINLLISGADVERMAQREPDSLAMLRQRLDSGTATLVGGEYEELELPLMTLEAIAGQFHRGLQAYETHLGHRPTVFGRRRCGLTPLLPQILKKFGFAGALHFTLDEGRFPTESQSRIRWEGVDGTEIEALARIPVDALRPENFLRLASRLGNVLDSDQSATAIFAHWPGQTSPWYGDLQRMSHYGPVLGKFTGLESYFDSTMYSGQAVRYPVDKYRTPYLKQEVAAEAPDPISRWVEFHRREVLAEDMQTVRSLTALLRGETEPASSLGETRPRGPDSSKPASSASCNESEPCLAEAVGQLATAIRGRGNSSRQGFLSINPRSHAIRSSVQLPDGEGLPAIAPPVLAAAESEGARYALVETPALGFAWIGADPQGEDSGKDRPAARKPAKEWPPLVEDHSLRNEYFQVQISPTTGTVQSIQNFAVRGNRLAQQLAMRLPDSDHRRDPDPESEANYSLIAADEITVGPLSPMRGSITSRGRLVDRAGTRLAGFVQTVTVQRGCPVLEIDVELDIERLPEGNPWDCYYASRFAWTDENAEVFQGVGLCRQPSEGKCLESPQFFDIRSQRTQLTLLAAGLPYHRRWGLRKLDTLLVVAGERARKFRFGIGVDGKYPAHAAIDSFPQRPELTLPQPAPPSRWGWLFHLDARNVIATRWESIIEEGKVRGFRVRLLETEGRAATAGLRSFRSPVSARKLDFVGEVHSELTIDGDEISVDLAPWEWCEVEGRFGGEE